MPYSFKGFQICLKPSIATAQMFAKANFFILLFKQCGFLDVKTFYLLLYPSFFCLGTGHFIPVTEVDAISKRDTVLHSICAHPKYQQKSQEVSALNTQTIYGT